MRDVRPAAHLVGILGSGLLRGLGATLRVRHSGLEHRDAAAAGGGFIYAFWHGTLLALAYAMRGKGITVLVSEHRDGEYIAQTIHRMGFATVRGSTTRGGYRSLLRMVSLGREGRAIAITPDGPRGPRCKVQPGTVVIPQRAGIPILPLAGRAWPRRELDSWDRFAIPRPFGKLVVGYGPPLEIPAGLKTADAVAEWAPKIEDAINRINERTERELMAWVGRQHGGDVRRST